MKKISTTLLIFFILSSIFANLITAEQDQDELISEGQFFNISSSRNFLTNAVVVPDTNPFYAIIGSSLACWYDISDNQTGLCPLIVQNKGFLTDRQYLFLSNYLDDFNKQLFVLGEKITTNFNKIEILGNPANVSIAAAKQVFRYANTVLILPYVGDEAYKLGLIASPLASYLNIPILLFDENEDEIRNLCKQLNVSTAYVVGNINLNLLDIPIIELKNQDSIQDTILAAIKYNFGKMNYLTITNPSDVVSSFVLLKNITSIKDHFSNVKLTLGSREFQLSGNPKVTYTIPVSNGIEQIQIYINITKMRKSLLKDVFPITTAYLYDPHGNIVAYSSSLGYDICKTYLETLTCNLSGTYKLEVKIYHGIKGGYFSQRGMSIADVDYEISISRSSLDKPHNPLVPNLSILAPYLTAAHGGLIIAEENFALTSDDYYYEAQGTGSGPWYNEKLHKYNNEKVNFTLSEIADSLASMENFGLLQSYISGPAWLAILGDTNMIPMYYYQPSQENLYEKGLASDNPYSFNWSLSAGRILGWDVQDVSLLIARTLFYEDICNQPNNLNDWHNRFSFIFGEGLGETGGIFHQIPYAIEITKYGFKPRVFGDFRNSRQIAELLDAYTGSNYIEYLGHGDWFWYTPSWYGFDYLGKAIDISSAKNWIFTKPSIFLTSACLMARIDGIPSRMNIGTTMLHAGCNSFVGATRETGREAGLTTLENHLIIDDLSIGEALRQEKRVDQQPPTYYVRILLGDPAFNPYEPNNGFSNQGIPILKNN
ncbi:MAG: hypothetical protein JXA91_00695 [Candidatus Thermoplasmatota archaeon]|nr:hypothetical protein [Candidatus Thermoplasmatota archaeon]